MPEASGTMSSAAPSGAVRGRPPAGAGEPPPEPLDDEEPLIPRPGSRCLSAGSPGTQQGTGRGSGSCPDRLPC